MKYEFDYALCVGEFMNFLARNYYSGETMHGYKRDLELFYRYMSSIEKRENFSMDDITKGELLAFMDHGREMGHSVNTIARRISTLKSFYKYLVYERDYPVDMAAKIRVPKTYIPLPRILTESEIEALLQAAGTIDIKYQLLFAVMYYTGSRLTAARTLKREHVSLEQRFLYFPKIKGGRDLYLPLHKELLKLFREYFLKYKIGQGSYLFPSPKIKGQAISAADVRKKLNMAAKIARIESKVTPHLLRHCTATHLTIRQVEQVKIANILGHADLRSTMRYQHLSVDHLRGAINRL